MLVARAFLEGDSPRRTKHQPPPTKRPVGRGLWQPTSNQDVPHFKKEALDFSFGTWVDYLIWPPAIRASQPWRRSKQAANQRPLQIHTAAVVSEMGASQVG